MKSLLELDREFEEQANYYAARADTLLRAAEDETDSELCAALLAQGYKMRSMAGLCKRRTAKGFWEACLSE